MLSLIINKRVTLGKALWMYLHYLFITGRMWPKGQFLTQVKQVLNSFSFLLDQLPAQSAEAVEYTNCISAEGKDSPNECPGYSIKQSNREAPEVMELWGMWSTPLLPLLPGPLWPRVVAPDRALSMSQKELFDI